MRKRKVGSVAISRPTYIKGKKETKVKYLNDSLIETAISALERAGNIVRYNERIASP